MRIYYTGVETKPNEPRRTRSKTRTIFSTQIPCNSQFYGHIFLMVYAWEDLVMSRINPHVVARNNAQNRSNATTWFKAALFANNNVENEIYAENPFHDFSFFSFYIEVRLQSRYTQIPLFNAIPSILLIISIPNVNIDTPSAVHMVMVMVQSRVSHTYREKVYERRGGKDITYANCVPGTMTVLNGFESANDMSARFSSSPIKPYPFETVSMISYLLTITLQQLRHAHLETLQRRRKLQKKLMTLRKYVMLDQWRIKPFILVSQKAEDLLRNYIIYSLHPKVNKIYRYYIILQHIQK